MALPAPLAVSADLSLVLADGHAITVTAAASVITVTLPRMWSRDWALGPLLDRRERRLLLASLHRRLRQADLTVQVKVRRQVVAQLRPGSRPSLLSRLLGLDAVEVRAIPCLRALLAG